MIVSLLHLMHAIACARASTLATLLIHVKNSTHHFCLWHSFSGTLKWKKWMEDQKHNLNSWSFFFNLSGFDLVTSDSYFTILGETFMNQILAENTYFTNHREWTEHKIMVLKAANKYQIIWHCHNFKNILIADFQHHSFLCWAKVF